MGVSYVFKIKQMVTGRETHRIFSLPGGALIQGSY